MWKERAVLTNRKGEEHGSVTPYQLTTILLCTTIGGRILAMPRMVAAEAGSGSPLAMLLGALPILLAWVLFVQLHRRFPHKTPAEYSGLLLTRPIGWLWVVSLIILLVVDTALVIREFGALVRTAVMPNTPVEVNIILLLLLVAYFVRFDVEVFARVFEVFFPVLFVPLTILGVLSLKSARFSFLLPIGGTDLPGLLRGAAYAATSWSNLIIAPFLMASLNRPKKALAAGMTGLGLTVFLYLLGTSAVIAVFGPAETVRLLWPIFELIKATTVPGFVLERLEAAFVGLWVVAVFTTVAATYYAAVVALAQLFRLRDHKVTVIPLVPVIYLIALRPPDTHTLYQAMTFVGFIGLMLSVASPVLFWLLSLLRGKGGRNGASQTE